MTKDEKKLGARIALGVLALLGIATLAVFLPKMLLAIGGIIVAMAIIVGICALLILSIDGEL